MSTMTFRPDWDTTWMDVAEAIGRRSLCERRRIGAVIVDGGNRPVAGGYNGPPRGLEVAVGVGCSAWCPRMVTDDDKDPSYDDCFTVHAEINALMFADRRDYEGGALYVTSSVCFTCAKAVANSGVDKVVMVVNFELDAHRDPKRSIDFLHKCGIDVAVW